MTPYLNSSKNSSGLEERIKLIRAFGEIRTRHYRKPRQSLTQLSKKRVREEIVAFFLLSVFLAADIFLGFSL